LECRLLAIFRGFLHQILDRLHPRLTPEIRGAILSLQTLEFLGYFRREASKRLQSFIRGSSFENPWRACDQAP